MRSTWEAKASNPSEGDIKNENVYLVANNLQPVYLRIQLIKHNFFPHSKLIVNISSGT